MLRNEYPRPDLVRKEWLCLNGEWQFAFDDESSALSEHWETPGHPLSKTITVPFCFESRLSGISDTSMHERCFYKRLFTLPDSWAGRDILLHFGAVDYRCIVFVNGAQVGIHEGGHSSFTFNISRYLIQNGSQELSVYVEDPPSDEAIPRGKQFWKAQSEGIWYTRTSGIWQSVWLEPVTSFHISHIKLTPDIDRGELFLEAEFSGFQPGAVLEAEIRFQGELISNDHYVLSCAQCFCRSIPIFGDQIFHGIPHGAERLWTPEHPSLYDITLKLYSEKQLLDQVDSYFGMRKIHTENGMTYLNNRPYYFRLVLDQGYWPDSIMTAPDDKAFQKDIQLAKEMGFNGCRKHQKAEDPRFLYWADQLGYLVWEEMAAASIFNEQANLRYTKEWMELIRRDYNHPCIVAWVPFNESWGIPNININSQQQAHTLSLYYLIKSLDPTRPVICNDGWELTKTDLCAIHNYNHGTSKEPEKRAFFQQTLREQNYLFSPAAAGRPIFAGDFTYEGQPILITECGGIHYMPEQDGGWGYSVAVTEEEYLEQYQFVIGSILSSDLIFGFCYTQLTDVEQETNGLLTADRTPKCKPEKIREFNTAYRHTVAISNSHKVN